MIHSNDSDDASVSLPELFKFLKDNSPEPGASCEEFGKYKIQDILSTRDNSAILLTFDPDLRRQVVLKVYKPSISKDLKQLIMNEGQALAQIECPHVARCMSVESLNGCPYLVLEYISGKTLDDLNLPLKSEAALEIVRQVAKGVESVHERGLLHLDLKPSNVILADDGTVKLIDFGLAQPMSGVIFGEVSGTPSYMPPEVARHEHSRIDRRADVFGVGAILYSLLTGKPVFRGETISETLEAAKKGVVVSPKEINPSISSFANELSERCLAENPANRYENILDVQAALEQEDSDRSRRNFIWPVFLTLILAWLVWFVLLRPAQTEFVNLEKQLVSLMRSGTVKSRSIGDFELKISNEAFLGEEPARIPQGETRLLNVSPSTQCFLAFFSVEYVNGDPNKISVAPIVNDGKVLFEVQSAAQHVHPIEFSILTPEDKVEFLVIAAKNVSWNPLETAKDAKAQLLSGAADVSRGAKGTAKSEFQAIRILPYQVVPNVDRTTSELQDYD